MKYWDTLQAPAFESGQEKPGTKLASGWFVIQLIDWVFRMSTPSTVELAGLLLALNQPPRASRRTCLSKNLPV